MAYINPVAGSLPVSLCEYATVHPDGTYSVVRGGIDQWKVTELPVQLVLFVLVAVPARSLEKGTHDFEAVFNTTAGMSLMQLAGVVQIVSPSSGSYFVFPLQASIQTLGVYQMNIRVADLRGAAVLDFHQRETLDVQG